jgi:hypothetical protein
MVLVSVCCLSQNKQIYIILRQCQSLMTNPGAASYKFYFWCSITIGISRMLDRRSFSAYDLFADNGGINTNCVM